MYELDTISAIRLITTPLQSKFMYVVILQQILCTQHTNISSLVSSPPHNPASTQSTTANSGQYLAYTAYE